MGLRLKVKRKHFADFRDAAVNNWVHINQLMLEYKTESY